LPYIGLFGRDVWEVGQSKGVISVRLDSDAGVGPWEPFQIDPTKYVYYGQHFLNGRTAEQNFGDPRVAALTLAVCAGDTAGIAQALKDGADPNGKGRDGDTPIFWTLDCENSAGLEALLKAGADPNYRLPVMTFARQDLFGKSQAPGRTSSYSAMYWAALMHKVQMLKLLLKYGGDSNAYKDSKYDETALVIAFEYGGRLEYISHDPHAWDEYYALLDSDKDVNRLPSGDAGVGDVGLEEAYNQTLAIYEASSGKFDKVEELLQRGYTYDPVDLAGVVQDWGLCSGCLPISPEKQATKSRILARLKKLGVYFPVPSRSDRWAGVRMLDDGTLNAHWGDLHSRHGVVEFDEIITKDDPRYQGLIDRVGGLKPGEQKIIKRRPDDARD
jgi:uncharacterized protein